MLPYGCAWLLPRIGYGSIIRSFVRLQRIGGRFRRDCLRARSSYIKGCDSIRSYLESTLLQLGYDGGASPVTAGTFIRDRGDLKIHSRGYRFPDGAEPARRFDIRFTNDVVTSLVDGASGKLLPLARLEPVEIGSIHRNEFEDRVMVSFAETPSRFLEILLAVEDRRYYRHIGVDPVGIARAAFSNLMSGKIEQGASTVTQQLVKNL